MNKFGPKVHSTLGTVPIILGALDLDHQRQITLHVCPHANSSTAQAMITIFIPTMQNTYVKSSIFFFWGGGGGGGGGRVVGMGGGGWLTLTSRPNLT